MCDVPGMPFAVDIGACGMGIDTAVFFTQLKQHQFCLIVQLDAEPVPADLIIAKLMRKPFVIHPGRASDLAPCATNEKLAHNRQPRK